mgnify:CR=1 FL=1
MGGRLVDGLNYQQQSLSLFKDRLSSRPLCSNNPARDGLYRLPLADALERLLIQPNTVRRYVCLAFDVDREQAAIDWSDRNAPAPNLSVMNPANGHAHLIYLLAAPVPVSDISRIKPVLFMAAVQEGLRRTLEADRGYAGLVVKNPMHKHWITKTWQERPYLLEDLAGCIDLPTPADMRRCSKAPNYAGLGRNCTVFEVVRCKAYSIVRDYWRPGGEADFFAAVLALVLDSNNRDLGRPLDTRECQGIARSICKWIWQRFTPEAFREIQAARGARKGFGKRERLLSAVKAMAAEGSSQREIAKALGVGQKTVSRWLSYR